ncbi:MAG: hypothetical protein JWQ22_801 [Devosia sp.]|nr:hypothetical protein [Devosia sp.]
MKNYTKMTQGQPEPDMDEDKNLDDMPTFDFLAESFDRLEAGRPGFWKRAKTPPPLSA